MQDFGFYFPIGWEHIIGINALDHQLFIAALAAIYTLKDWKPVLILVTAFTIGHSLTLALSVLNLISLDSRLVEILIPVTIIITAFSNFFQKEYSKKALRLNYFLALFFGLIHGLGFANTIRFMLASDQSIGMPLFAFNIGLEAGQLVIVAIILIINFILLNWFNVKRRDWVLVLSAIVLSQAITMTIERISQ